MFEIYFKAKDGSAMKISNLFKIPAFPVSLSGEYVEITEVEYKKIRTLPRLTFSASGTLAKTVLEALLQVDETFYADKRVVWVKLLTEKVNELRDGKEHGAIIKSRHVGEVLNKFLDLQTVRATSGSLRGYYFVFWDDEKIKNLCVKYGINSK